MSKQKDKNSFYAREKANVRKIWVEDFFVYLIFSFCIPFGMALLEFLVSDYTLKEIYSGWTKFLLVGAVYFFALMSLTWYLKNLKREVFLKRSTSPLLSFSFALILLVSTLISESFSLYAVPLVFFGLMIGILFDVHLAIVANVLTPFLFFIGFWVLNPNVNVIECFDSAIIQALAGIVMISACKNKTTRISLFMHSFYSGILVVVPLSLFTTYLTKGFAPDVWRPALVNGGYSVLSIFLGLGIYLVLSPIFEYLFGLYTNFRLEEICSTDAPLIRRLALEAPGTYNHSVVMSTMAGDCALAIGENPALARAGALYHDVGKLMNPDCFTENQTGYNPHDDFIPEVSASIITKHTKNGAEMIRKAGLPEEIALIAEEHHGTQTVSYFLNKAKGITDQHVNKDLFRYKGPKPTTKISALIMIVDTVEAATRAQGIDKDTKAFSQFIHTLITQKVTTGQFSDCPLTQKDLTVIEETLVRLIPNLYHQRIKYTK